MELQLAQSQPKPAAARSVVSSNREAEEVYARQGMGRRISFGERPAVLIIDMQHHFCDANAPYLCTLLRRLIAGSTASRASSIRARRQRHPMRRKAPALPK